MTKDDAGSQSALSSGSRDGQSKSRRRDIGFGVSVTENEDGVFIHFKLPGGRGMGFCVDETSQSNLLGRETLHKWALAILGDDERLRPLEKPGD